MGVAAIIYTDLQILAQESLEEATLPTAPSPQDIAAKDTALGLFLLQINALVTRHWKNRECIILNTYFTYMKNGKMQ